MSPQVLGARWLLWQQSWVESIVHSVDVRIETQGSVNLASVGEPGWKWRLLAVKCTLVNSTATSLPGEHSPSLYSPTPLSIPDLTQTISPRRASMTCTCEGLKNVTSQPPLHSPGAATAGSISNRVLAGWGQGTRPMCWQAGWDCLPIPYQSQGTAAFHLAARRSQREISVSLTTRETPAT